ncbi:MAG: terminase small subunit [Pseudomonadota bacterium]|uniref:terminase small subunit n=1 Tax=Thalassovita sp. TaxID=1979401 RepID=UPI002AAF7144|nr:terminase small subunit [Thalassovita sp.]MEC8194725.1 terminase small subunit [Pseudomonadota bacterium]
MSERDPGAGARDQVDACAAIDQDQREDLQETGAQTEPPRDEPVLNRGQIALCFDVSENTIDKWIRKGMPVESKGTNGKSYQFYLSDCKAWRNAEIESERQSQAAADLFVQQERAKYLNVGAGSERAGMTPAQMREMAQAELLHMQAAQKRGALVHVEEMVDLMDAVFGEVRSALDGLPDWMEREFGLSPEQVERAIGYCDGVMQEMHDRLSEAHLGQVEGVIDEGDRRLI